MIKKNAVIILILTLFSCTNKTGNVSWLTTLEKMDLKGEVMKLTESRYSHHQKMIDEEFFFDEDGLLSEKKYFNGDAVERIEHYKYDHANRLLEIKTEENGETKRYQYKYEENHRRMFLDIGLQTPFMEFELDSIGRVIRTYNLREGVRWDSTVTLYSGKLKKAEQNYIDKKLKLHITYSYDKNDLLTGTHWLQYLDDSVQKIDTKHYYELDGHGNWVRKTDVRTGDTVYVIYRQIIYRD